MLGLVGDSRNNGRGATYLAIARARRFESAGESWVIEHLLGEMRAMRYRSHLDRVVLAERERIELSKPVRHDVTQDWCLQALSRVARRAKHAGELSPHVS